MVSGPFGKPPVAAALSPRLYQFFTNEKGMVCTRVMHCFSFRSSRSKLRDLMAGRAGMFLLVLLTVVWIDNFLDGHTLSQRIGFLAGWEGRFSK